jgi:hypothetical protein
LSVVLPDVPIGAIERLLVLVELVLEERLAGRHLHLTLTRVGLLPAGESDIAHDLVDVGHDALDDDRRVLVSGVLEELSERRLAEVFFCDGLGGVLGGDDVAGELEECLQELDADEQTLGLSRSTA